VWIDSECESPREADTQQDAFRGRLDEAEATAAQHYDGTSSIVPAAPFTAKVGGGSGIRHQTLFAWLFGALIVVSWGALWLLSASPYGRYVGHGGYLDPVAFAELCRAIPGGEFIVPASLYAAGWLLMIAAMMLPTTFPLLALFRRIVAGRADAGRLMGLAVAGFIAAWLAFGLVAHAADATLRAAAAGDPWLVGHGWIVGAAVFGAAGLFQFSALKYRCLEQCRTPFAFVAARWHGHAPAREAFRLGADHGIFCVGCCWALMLVMFVVGTASVGWMLALAALMAAEKNLPGGARLRLPIGLGLLGAAAALVVSRI
jgi:predicted metal-binding membrane protein